MGFMTPNVPKAPPPPNPAISAIQAESAGGGVAPSTGSLISTAARGLKRRASTQRTSLIGGA